MNRLSRIALPPMRIIMVLLAVSVSISVALDNLLLAVLLLFGLLGCIRQTLIEGLQNPVARAAWLLFGMLLLATLYGPTPWREALSVLAKYDDLAMVPLFMVVFQRGATGRLALYIFMLAVAATVLLSGSLVLEFLYVHPWMWSLAAPDNGAVFHSYITQGMMTDYAIFLALLWARSETVAWKRAAFGIFAVLGTFNVLFQVSGRTAYLILFALLLWLGWSTLKRHLHARGKSMNWLVVLSVFFVAVMSAWAAYHASSHLHDRVDLMVYEYLEWQPNGAGEAANTTSTGERLEFYYNTLRIVHEHPFAGVGTGGFPDAYAKQVAGTDIVPTSNPHNEYLLLMTQGGLPALALMLYWLYVQWREAPRLENPFRRDAARGLVITIAVSCLVNSSLLDHTEGLFFAFMSALLFANLRKAQR